MVECGGFPAACGVAGATFAAKLAVVGVFLDVAVAAVGRCVLQVGAAARVKVALTAQDFGMLAIQFEGQAGVVEVFVVGVDAVVACQAAVAIGQGVGGGEGYIHLSVAGFTGG